MNGTAGGLMLRAAHGLRWWRSKMRRTVSVLMPITTASMTN